jgi:hypothetical protein
VLVRQRGFVDEISCLHHRGSDRLHEKGKEIDIDMLSINTDTNAVDFFIERTFPSVLAIAKAITSN